MIENFDTDTINDGEKGKASERQDRKNDKSDHFHEHSFHEHSDPIERAVREFLERDLGSLDDKNDKSDSHRDREKDWHSEKSSDRQSRDYFGIAEKFKRETASSYKELLEGMKKDGIIDSETYDNLEQKEL